MKRFSLLALLMLAALPAAAQEQRIGYVDSEYIFSKLPAYTTVQQTLERQAQAWQREVEEREAEVDEMFRDYQARELLYTAGERQQRRDEIVTAEREVEVLRTRYFGPEGELYRQQETLMRPIQEQLLTTIDDIARRDDYAYVFDKSGDFLFLFAREQDDLSDEVLRELGVDVDDPN
jgi:outer membrane protein